MKFVCGQKGDRMKQIKYNKYTKKRKESIIKKLNNTSLIKSKRKIIQ